MRVETKRVYGITMKNDVPGSLMNLSDIVMLLLFVLPFCVILNYAGFSGRMDAGGVLCYNTSIKR